MYSASLHPGVLYPQQILNPFPFRNLLKGAQTQYVELVLAADEITFKLKEPETNSSL